MNLAFRYITNTTNLFNSYLVKERKKSLTTFSDIIQQIEERLIKYKLRHDISV